MQAGAERFANAVTAVMAGVSVISGVGSLGNALISTPEQLVIDNEIIGILQDLRKGVTVTPQTLAHDYLAEGVGEGTFLASQHTLDHLRSGQMWMPDLFCCEPYESWAKKETDLIGRATARVSDILANHEVAPLDAAKDKEIEAIIAPFK